MEFYGILWDNLFYCQWENKKIIAPARSEVFRPSGAERERGRVERGDEKPRGRGLGQRNMIIN